MNRQLEFIVSGEFSGKRLDAVLAQLIPDSSRAYLQKLIKDGAVQVDGTPETLPRLVVKANSKITVFMPEAVSAELAAEDFDFEILHEDNSILVINKPAGVVVHPGAGNYSGTVVNALLGRYPGLEKLFPGDSGRPGIVHRLDKDTSGCLVIAKTPEAMFKLGQAFSEHTANKTYLAICIGNPPQEKTATITTLIGRHPVNRQKMAIVDSNGKEAVTTYTIISSKMVGKVPLSLVKVNIATGRTHQIRVHMASLGVPVVGDQLYGRNTGFPGVERQLLHAWKLALPHPETGTMIEFKSPVPDDFQKLLQYFNVKVK
ncbi:MAG: RluA family pseudouridine synthase [Lentisphaerae bacterium]|nr:RluA family pseudouridine synthase [Lentisphaerota bacterium]